MGVFAHEAMATVFEAIVAGRDEAYARQAARAAFDEVDRIEKLFSRFDPSSEISRLSRLRPGEVMRVGCETFDVLAAAAGMQAETAGAFDVNFRTGGKPVRLLDLIALRRLPDGFEIERLAGPRRRKFRPLDLDLGAIGKGYAVDAALGVFREWDVENVLLHSGTSTVAARGTAPGRRGKRRGWPVAVATAWAEAGAPREIILKNLALSGSGTEVKGEHVVDPRLDWPAMGHLAAWAAHTSAAVSDALATAFMVMMTEEVEAFCARRPDVWALVISEEYGCRVFNEALLTSVADF
jgi:thiamine biosynthesis lipoprotein